MLGPEQRRRGSGRGGGALRPDCEGEVAEGSLRVGCLADQTVTEVSCTAGEGGERVPEGMRLGAKSDPSAPIAPSSCRMSISDLGLYPHWVPCTCLVTLDKPLCLYFVICKMGLIY